MLNATVEYGVFGYEAFTRKFEAKTVRNLILQINKMTAGLTDKVALADAENGDLRGYCPLFANGYPSFGGFEPEFGEGEWYGCLTGFGKDGAEFEYNSVKHKALRAGANIN